MAAYSAIDDSVFRALADPTRRQLLDSLNDRNGQTLRELCSGLRMARQSVSKHIAILEAAGLVTPVRRGREKLHYLNAAPINAIGERWITRYDRGRVEALADLKRALEAPPMDKPSFVYTTYIRTTPERLWQALTDPAFTRRYWNAAFETDWKPGSPMTWDLGGIVIRDPEQVVLEAEPHRRLSFTWHTFTPELNASHGFTDEVAERISAEARSKATFEIEPVGDDTVRLTVVHEGLDPDGIVPRMIGNGWPLVLSRLKSLLETGEALPPTSEPPLPVRLGLTAR
jgi:uncharacterized protein YndB with AHSA1/START domain/DNA-binding transcriptional ArsR family regulator